MRTSDETENLDKMNNLSKASIRTCLCLFAFVLITPEGCGNLANLSSFINKTTYTVTYYPNDSTSGSVPVDSKKYTDGQTVQVLGNSGELAKTGGSYIGWNTKADGSETAYLQDQTFTMGETDVSLYAQWTTNPTFTVTYNGNAGTGGTAPVDTTNYQQGRTVTVFGNSGNLVNANCSFAGWNTAADGSGTPYSIGGTFTMGSANVVLYAQWNTNLLFLITHDAGNLSEYSSTVGTLSATVAAKHDGAYGLYLPGTLKKAIAWKNVSCTEIYLGVWVYIDPSMTMSQDDEVTLFGAYSSTSSTGIVIRRLGAGNGHPDAWDFGDAVYDSTTFSTGAWHYLEMYWKVYSSSGIKKCWVDGKLLKNSVRPETSTSIVNVGLGLDTPSSSSSGFLYFDTFGASITGRVAAP